jgi:hypothetical protein
MDMKLVIPRAPVLTWTAPAETGEEMISQPNELDEQREHDNPFQRRTNERFRHDSLHVITISLYLREHHAFHSKVIPAIGTFPGN